VIAAIKDQLDQYLHVMVYGEFVQSPQVQYAKLLTEHLPASLNSVYFTNSGAEAVEGAMKLAKRVTGRTEIIAFNKAYHGSTQGALSLIGSEYWRNSYRPLLPGVTHLDYNAEDVPDQITEAIACVIMETVQGEAGVVVPQKEWIQAIASRCKETGALLVLDEIQAGFGRTGKLWAFEHFDLLPDILLLGKALGGGMPLGAFIANKDIMSALTENPVLGHITTFGGHPVCCAAGMEAFKVLLEEDLAEASQTKGAFLKQKLQTGSIKQVNSCGLWMALEFETEERCKKVIDQCLQNGLLTDWFLFAPASLRISPPLTITEADLEKASQIINEAAQSPGLSS
jgi:acetylornithine/N-succinyldiaminopimelate aminotransferase